MEKTREVGKERARNKSGWGVTGTKMAGQPDTLLEQRWHCSPGSDIRCWKKKKERNLAGQAVVPTRECENRLHRSVNSAKCRTEAFVKIGDGCKIGLRAYIMMGYDV